METASSRSGFYRRWSRYRRRWCPRRRAHAARSHQRGPYTSNRFSGSGVLPGLASGAGACKENDGQVFALLAGGGQNRGSLPAVRLLVLHLLEPFKIAGVVPGAAPPACCRRRKCCLHQPCLESTSVCHSRLSDRLTLMTFTSIAICLLLPKSAAGGQWKSTGRQRRITNGRIHCEVSNTSFAGSTQPYAPHAGQQVADQAA